MLSAPSFVLWIISTLIAIAVILLTYFDVSIPVIAEVMGGREFEFFIIAYVLLWAGTIFKRA